MAKLVNNRDKKNLSVTIHESAYPAFSFFQQQVRLFQKEAINLDVVSTLNKGLTLHAINNRDGKIALISGFEFMSFSLAYLSLDDYIIVLYSDQELTESEIEHRAWCGVFRSCLSTLDNQYIENFRRSINELAPIELRQSLFNKKQVSQNSMANITSMSRSALAQQHRKLTQTPSPKDACDPSTFEALLQSRLRND